MAAEMPPIAALRCPVMNYAWGKVGSSSAVAQLSRLSIDVDEKAPYAELWMGTHKKGPAMVIGEGGASAEESKLSDRLGKELPFLFKVLSVNKALSIQAHPDKKLAERLHRERKDVYKDPNHKPEMACAVTEFEAMCGFRPAAEIAANLASYPEFRAVVGEDLAKAFIAATDGDDAAEQKAALRKVFTQVMKADAADVKKGVDAMAERLAESDTELDALICRLNQQYPSDVGVFAPLFLNYVKLSPGDAMFLDANEPHAYLSGDCIECMACSDNVVRAGLTPKLRDTPTLCSMLTYKAMRPSIMRGVAIDGNSRVMRSPNFSEFALTASRVSAGSSYALPPAASDSIVLAYAGSGAARVDGLEEALPLRKGSVFFVRRGVKVTFEAKGKTQDSDADELVIYRCSEAFEPKKRMSLRNPCSGCKASCQIM